MNGTTANTNTELCLRDIFLVVWQSKWLITFVVISMAVLAAIVAYTTTPVYRATVLMAPADDNSHGGLSSALGQFGGLASLAGIQLSPGGGGSEDAIATLTSRAFTEQFIRKHNLLPILFADQWDPERASWRTDEPAPGRSSGYILFDDKIRDVTVDTKSGLITLSIEWTDPELAAEWANKLIRDVNGHLRQRQIEEAQASIGYLERELETTSIAELRTSIYRLIEGQINTVMLANVREQFAFRVIDPAVAPEPWEHVRPKPVLLVAFGIIIGGVIGVFLAFFRHYLRSFL